jgi:hypothetical protein
MIATVELYELTTDALIKLDRRDRKIRLFYVVKIASLVKYFQTSTGAHKYLIEKGFIMNDDYRTYTLKHKSDDEIYLERHYKKC